MKDYREVILAPIATEKTTNIMADGNRIVFKVHKDANKTQIKQAVEVMFNVKVKSVHTAIFAGKAKRMGMHEGKKSDWKKAIVQLEKGQEINLVDEA